MVGREDQELNSGGLTKSSNPFLCPRRAPDPQTPRSGVKTAPGAAPSRSGEGARGIAQPSVCVGVGGGGLPPPDTKLLLAARARPSLPQAQSPFFKVTSPGSFPSVTGLAQTSCPESETIYMCPWHIDSSRGQESLHLAPSFISVLWAVQGPHATLCDPPSGKDKSWGLWSDGGIQPWCKTTVWGARRCPGALAAKCTCVCTHRRVPACVCMRVSASLCVYTALTAEACF